MSQKDKSPSLPHLHLPFQGLYCTSGAGGLAEPLVDGDPKYLIVEISGVQVGLNTNLLYKSDLLSDGVEDPGLQLAWLRNTLMEVDAGDFPEIEAMFYTVTGESQ